MPSNEGKKELERPVGSVNASPYTAIFAMMRFSLSSLRGRSGQAIPVTLALLLMVSVAQAIGGLGDVSSTLTRQQIAANWRAPADLLVRPQAAVSQPERDAGWINPQSALEYYGGIDAQQIASIASLSQVTQIVPFASVGWQRIDVVTPVVLQEQGVYRITAQWRAAQQSAGNVVDYVEVSDLAGLTHQVPLLRPIVQHLVLQAHTGAVVYDMAMPALQLLVGAAQAQELILRQLLLQGNNLISSARLTIHVDKLNGQMTMLSSCIEPALQAACWQPVTVQVEPVSYLAQDVQLLRFSQARYNATAQQIAAGQLTLAVAGEDVQGVVYRTLLPQHMALESDGAGGFATERAQQTEVAPLTGPEHMPALPGALQFVPLAQACLVNGAQCYSGLYIRLRGVERYNSKSLALLQATAAAITARTGLHVDILDGASTRIITLTSANANNAISIPWGVTGVAVQITHGVDALQNTLFLLCALICLLATGAAGVLIGIGRRNEARTLEQLGWSRSSRAGVHLISALLLALPGCALASLLICLVNTFWPGNVSISIMWALLATGIMIYSVSLVGLACGSSRSPSMRKRTSAFHARITTPLVCSIAISAMVFLVAMEYLMVNGLNRELVVTVLGDQVRVALEGPQLLLLLLVLLTALLTVGLCTSLLLRGRREELALLAKLGWEQRHVLLRLLRESWWMAALSGLAGALLALIVVALAGSLPAVWIVCGVLLSGPMLGMVLADLVVYSLARQELRRVYLERA